MMGHVNSGDLESAKAIKSKLEVLQSEYQRIGGEKEKIILDSLKSGSYKAYNAPTNDFRPYSGNIGSTSPEINIDKTESNLKSQISDAFGIDPEKLDVSTGAAGKQQLMTGLLGGDAETAAKYLAKNYKAVQPLEVDGKQNFLVKTNDDKFMLVNQPRAKWKDAYAALLPEVIPTIYGIVGGGAAVAAAPESAGASLFAAPAASSAMYAVGKGAQTAIARGMADIPIDAPQIGIQMAKDTAIGTVLGTGMGLIGRSAIKTALPAVVNAQEVSLGKAIMQTKKLIPELEIPAGSWGGSKQMEKMRSLAGEFPNSNLAKQYTKNLSRLEGFQKAYLTGEATPDATRQVVLDSLKQDFDNAAAAVAGKDQELKNTMLQALNDRLERVTMATQEKRALGEGLHQMAKEGLEAGTKLKNDAFGTFFAAADAKGVNMTVNEARQAIFSGLGKSRFKQSAAVERLVNDHLPPAGGQAPLNAAAIRDLIQMVRDSVPTELTGASTASQVAGAAAEGLDGAFKNKLAQAKILPEWETAVDVYKKSYLAYKTSSPSAVLAEQFGSEKLAPTAMVDRLLSNEKAAGDFIGALHNAGKPELADQAQRQLQAEYLKQIGAAGTGDTLESQLKHTPEMVDALFGRTPEGAVNPLKSARMMGALDSINEVLKLKGIKPKNIQAGDVDRVLSALSEKEKQAAIKILEERATLDSEKQKLVQNKLMSAVKKGNFQLADMDQFAETLMTATPEEVGAIIPKLPLSAQDSVKISSRKLARSFQRLELHKERLKRGWNFGTDEQ